MRKSAAGRTEYALVSKILDFRNGRKVFNAGNKGVIIMIDIVGIYAMLTAAVGILVLLWKIFIAVNGWNKSIIIIFRYCMDNIYNQCRKTKKISRFSKAIFTELYDQYKNVLHANSYADQIAKEVLSMKEIK